MKIRFYILCLLEVLFLSIICLGCNNGTKPVYATDESYDVTETNKEAFTTSTSQNARAFALSGRVQTATGTSLNMIVDWSATRAEGEAFCTFTADLYIEHRAISAKNFSGSFTVNGKERKFISPVYEYKSSNLTREKVSSTELKIPCDYSETTYIDVRAKWSFDGLYEGDLLNEISLSATVPIGEKYATLKTSAYCDVEVILQDPKLPEGCEVTSLAMLLRYLGYNISHTTLADDFLPIGSPGKDSYYEYNLGNPRLSGQSWGCYAPVIVKTANKYLSTEQSKFMAFNYTGFDISEIYYQISMGHPVIVWITMDYVEPFTTNAWKLNGKNLYWKYPLHCVVLSGYNTDAKTVQITDPKKDSPITIDMNLFELRWRQMESQAVVIK